MDKNKTNVPKIRFPGFTDPWEQHKLSEGMTEYTDRIFIEDNKIYKQISVKNIGEIVLRGQQKGSKIGRKRQAKVNLTKHPNTLIFTRQTIEQGGIGFAPEETNGAIVTENMPTIDVNCTVFDKKYLLSFIKTSQFRKQVILSNIQGGTAQIAIHEDDILKSEALFPKLKEQQKIGVFFKQLDDLITLHQRKLNHLQDKKKSLLQKMFPKNGEYFPELRFPGFTDPWEQRKVGELTNVTSAARVHKEEWVSSGIPFFRSSDVVSAYKGTENEKVFISYELFEQLSKVSGKLGKDDVLVTGGGSIGIPYIVPNNMPLYSKDADLIWIKSSKKFNSQYLYTFFMTSCFRKYVSSISHIGTIAHYTIEQIKDTPIYTPSLAEQEKVGVFFKQLDNLIALHQRKLKHLQEQKKALLQQMFV